MGKITNIINKIIFWIMILLFLIFLFQVRNIIKFTIYNSLSLDKMILKDFTEFSNIQNIKTLELNSEYDSASGYIIEGKMLINKKDVNSLIKNYQIYENDFESINKENIDSLLLYKKYGNEILKNQNCRYVSMFSTIEIMMIMHMQKNIEIVISDKPNDMAEVFFHMNGLGWSEYQPPNDWREIE